MLYEMSWWVIYEVELFSMKRLKAEWSVYRNIFQTDIFVIYVIYLYICNIYN